MTGNPIEGRFPLVFRSLLLRLLELFPLCPHCIHCLGVAVPEDMWMSVHQLVDNALGDLIEIVGLAFLGELAMENDLEQKISEFFDHFLFVSRLDGIDEFIDLLDGVKAEAHVVLFSIPRAAFRGTKCGHYVQELPDGWLVLAGGIHRSKNDEIVSVHYDFSRNLPGLELLRAKVDDATAEFGAFQITDGYDLAFAEFPLNADDSFG